MISMKNWIKIIAHNDKPLKRIGGLTFQVEAIMNVILSKLKPNQRNYVSDLREELNLKPANLFDRVIIELQKDGCVSLFPFDDPTDMITKDIGNGIKFGGDTQYIIYLTI